MAKLSENFMQYEFMNFQCLNQIIFEGVTNGRILNRISKIWLFPIIETRFAILVKKQSYIKE